MFAFAFVLFGLQFNTFAQDDLPVLELNKPVLGEVEFKKSNSYEIKLEAAQYVYILVEYKGTDLDTELRKEGKTLYKSGNLSGGSLIKTVHYVTENPGNYRLEIISGPQEKRKVKYRVTVKEIREATEKDRFLATAEKTFAEGELLQSERNKESFLKAIEKYKEAVGVFESSGNLKRKGQALTNLGLAYYSLGDTQKSLDTFKKVLEIAKSTGDRNTEAKILNNVGSIYNRMGDTANAIAHFSRSLKIVRELNIVQGEAAILGNLASIYKVTGEFEKALDYANKSLALHRKTPNKAAQANTLNSIGTIYDDMGEPQKALRFFNESLKLFQEGDHIRKQAAALNNIGAAYGKLGDKRRALDIYLKVLTLVQESGNKVGEAQTLNNIGSVYTYLGDFKKSLEYLGQSLTLIRQTKDRLGESFTLTSIGLAHNKLGDSEKALDFLQQALVITQEINARHQEAIIHNYLGKLFAATNDKDKSLNSFEKSLAIAESIGDTFQQSKALFELAELDQENENFEEAENKINTAVKFVEDYRAKIGSQELKTSYLSISQNIYKFYINLLMQLHIQSPTKGFDIKAFNVSEQARARSMVENLAESRIKIREGVNPELLRREREIQRKLNKKESERIKFANRKGGETPLKAITEEIKVLLNEYKDAKTQIRISSPRYAELTEPKSLSLKDIQKSLDSESVLLEYSLGEKRSYVWAVKADSITSYQLPKKAEIEKNASKTHKLLTSRNELIVGETPNQRENRIKEADKALAIAFQELSRQIIHPIAKQLDKNRIVVVSEGALQYVPFGVLSNSEPGKKENHQPLIVKHEIVSLPSASILEALRNRSKTKKPMPDSVAVIADPVFSESDPRVAESIARLENKPKTQNVKLSIKSDDSLLGELKRSADDLSINEFRRLRFSRREANDIAAFASEEKQLKAVDFAADRDLFLKQDLSKYQILHFATHGLLNNRNPELSGIVLSLVDENGKSKDGFLRLHDIYNMKIGADLVVLSACQTALGKDVKGEGLIGLTRGFMYAGAESVVASLWQVEDRATAELMKKFYRAMLKDGLKPAAALRLAQVEMIKEDRWSNPYYWAAFTLQGEWR